MSGSEQNYLKSEDMSMFEELMKKFGRREEPKEDEIEFKEFEESTGNPTTVKMPEEKSASIASKSDSVELKVLRPECYNDVADVADSLLDGCTVVLNVEAIDKPTIVRMLDFINGVTYCTDGEIKKVAAATFIITPHSNVDVSDF